MAEAQAPPTKRAKKPEMILPLLDFGTGQHLCNAMDRARAKADAIRQHSAGGPCKFLMGTFVFNPTEFSTAARVGGQCWSKPLTTIHGHATYLEVDFDYSLPGGAKPQGRFELGVKTDMEGYRTVELFAHSITVPGVELWENFEPGGSGGSDTYQGPVDGDVGEVLRTTGQLPMLIVYYVVKEDEEKKARASNAGTHLKDSPFHPAKKLKPL